MNKIHLSINSNAMYLLYNSIFIQTMANYP